LIPLLPKDTRNEVEDTAPSFFRLERLGRRRFDTRPVSAAGPAVSSLLCESRPHAEQAARVHRVHASCESEGAEVSAL
jgi:hypothetical protein